MGNNSTKQQIKDRPKKNVHWKSAEPPSSPGKPVLVQSIDITPDVITLQWDLPHTDGGSPIIGYLVEHRRTGSPHWVRATPALIPYPELSLSGLEPGWRYQFRVSAENAVGPSEYSELSDPLTVTLQRNAVVPPRFLAELHDTIAMENEKVEFQVQAIGTPPPQINWFKDGFEIFSSRRTKIINEVNASTLIIHQAALTDEGEIKCSATNRAGHVVTRAQLKLEAPPKIRLPRQYEDGLLIEAEEIIRLKVGLAGRPAPTVIWTHNGEQIRNGMLPRYELITTDKNSSLKITNSKRSDRGEYHLCAINKIGEDNASFLVTVTAKPSPPGKVMITMSLGKSVTLSWQASEDDGGCKIGNYIIEYFRIGWNVWLKALTTRQLTATINDLIEGSEYKFRVKAENPYGLSEPSNESNVLFVPDPKRGIRSSTDENSFEFIHNITDYSLMSTPGIMPRHKKPTNVTFGSSKQSLDLEQEQEKLQSVSKMDKQEQTSKSPSGQDRIGKMMSQPQSRQKTQVAPIIQLSPNVYDGEKFAREMSYGTSDDIFNRRKEFKQTKSIPKYYEEDNDRYPIMDGSHSPDSSLMNENRKQQIDLQIQKQQTTGISSDSDNYNSDSVRRPLTGKLTLSPLSDRRNVNLETPRESGDEVHTSNEFVLVLYDDDNNNNNRKRNQQANKENNSFELELEDSIIPPPISLSAPELGAEPPSPPMIRRSVSSTELLYERAMARFYQAVELEEANENARRMSIQSQQQQQNPIQSQVAQPTITESTVQKRRLSDIDRQSSFERKNMLRKRLSSDITPVALNDIHKELDKNEKLNRFIKQNSDDIDEENKLQKIASSQKEHQSFEVDNKNDKYEEEYDNDEENDIDEYDEDDEEEDCDENLKSENFTADYTDSTASSSSLDSIEAFKKAVLNSPRLSLTTSPTSSHVPSPSPQPLTEDELDTYNHSKSQQSRERTLSPYRTPEPNQSTIVLTKPLPLPNPDFVPKPILKRPSIDSNSNGSTSTAPAINTAIISTENECKVKKKTIGKKKQSTKNNKTERKSLLHMFERNKKQSTSAESNLNKNNNNNTKCDDNDSMKKNDRKIKAELEKKKSMENRQNSLEENQVVIEYYSDIVKEAAIHRRPPNKVPLYMSSEELKKAAEKAEQEERLLKLQNNSNISPSREYIQPDDELQYENNNNSMKSDSIGNISTIPNSKILEKTTHSNSKTCYSMELLPGISKEEVNVIVTKSTTKTKIIDDMISTKEKQPQQHDELYKKSSNKNIINSSDNNIYRNELELNRKHQSVEQLGTLERGRTKNTGAIPKKRSQSGSVTRSSIPLNSNSSTRPTTNPNASSLQKISTTENDIHTRISSRNTSRTRLRSESKSPAVKNRSMLITSVSLPISSPLQRKIPLKKSMHVLSLSERSPSPPPSPISSASQRSQTPDQLLQEDIEIKVKSTMDYCTDLAMFFVACWLYMFKDAKLAIPILALMIYRQLGDALKDKLPKWMKRKRD